MRKKVIVIIILICIVIFISASFFNATEVLKEIITRIIGKISEIINNGMIQIRSALRRSSNWIKALVGMDDYTLPGGKDAQMCTFVISQDQYLSIEKEIDNAINLGEGGYNRLVIKKMLLTYYSSICTRDTQILLALDDNEKMEDFSDAEGTFEKVTSSDIGEDGDNTYISTYGIVELYQDGIVDDEHKMIYLPPETDDATKNKETISAVVSDAKSGSKDADNAKKALKRCYTIENIGEITMYAEDTTKVKEQSSYDGESLSETRENEDSQYSKINLKYQQYSNEYTVPVEFLVSLLNLTGSTDFIDGFSKLQYDSYIRMGVYETGSQTQVIQEKTSKATTELKGEMTSSGDINIANLEDLKKKFPNGKYWGGTTSNGYGNDYDEVRDYARCTTQQDNGCVSPYFDGGRQCFGFARKIAYDYYGTLVSTWQKVNGAAGIKPGDVVRFDLSGKNPINGTHSAWVVAVNNNELTLVECNLSKCNITWGRKCDTSKVIYYRKAPYAIGDTNDPHNSTKNEISTQTINTNTTQNSDSEVNYSETKDLVEKTTTTKTVRNYEMDIIEVDNWYVKLSKNNKKEQSVSAKVWNDKEELIDANYEIQKDNTGINSDSVSFGDVKLTDESASVKRDDEGPIETSIGSSRTNRKWKV